ncbi:hypothetical protein [Martelella lutilitoris]|nr:hypothetical protein [Martelella lutilitoris]
MANDNYSECGCLRRIEKALLTRSIKDLHTERESYIKDQEALGC